MRVAKILRILKRRERTGLTVAACLFKALGYTVSLFVYASPSSYVSVS